MLSNKNLGSSLANLSDRKEGFIYRGLYRAIEGYTEPRASVDFIDTNPDVLQT